MRYLFILIYIGFSLTTNAQNRLYPISKNGKWGLVNNAGTFICEPIFDYVNYSKTGKKYIYSLNGKKGLVSENGVILTKPLYTDINLLDTIWSSSFIKGNWNLFNSTYEVAKHEYSKIEKIDDDLFLAISGINSILIKPFGKTHQLGNFVSATLKDNYIVTLHLDSTLSIFNKHTLHKIEENITSISNEQLGYRIVEKQNIKQFFNPKELRFRGKKMMQIRLIKDDIYACSNDLHFIYFLKNNTYFEFPLKANVVDVQSKYVIFDTKGKQGVYDLFSQTLIIPAIYDKINYSSGRFLVNTIDKYGCYSTTGKKLVPCIYNEFDIYDNSIVVKSENGSGLYALNGKKIEDAIYDEIKVYAGKIKCYKSKSLLIINLSNKGELLNRTTYNNFMSVSIGPTKLPIKKFQEMRLGGDGKEQIDVLANREGWFRPIMQRTVKDSIINFYGRWGLKDDQDSICIRPRFKHIELKSDYDLTACYVRKPYRLKKGNARFQGIPIKFSKKSTIMYDVPFYLADHKLNKMISKSYFLSLKMNDFANYTLARGFTDEPVLVAINGDIVIKGLSYYGDYKENILTICKGGEKTYNKVASTNNIGTTSSFISRTGAINMGFSKYRIHADDWYMSIKNGQWHYIDKNGNQLNEKPFQFGHDFIEGKAIVKLNNKWGVIDTAMSIIVPIIYDNVTRIWESYGSKDNYYFKVENRVANNYFYNKQSGKLTNTNIAVLGEYCNGIWTYKKENDNKWGLIDTTLNSITETEYSKFFPFSNGKSIVYSKGKKSIIDTEGEFTIPFYRAKKITTLSHNYYAIHQNKGIMVINQNGDTLLEATKCKQLIDWNDNFLIYKDKRKVICALSYDETIEIPKKTKLIWMSISDGVVLLKKKGKLKLYSIISKSYLNKKVIGVSKIGEQSMIYKSKKGLFGYLSFSGDTLTQPIFKKLDPIKNGWAFAQKNKRKMIIDRNGNEIFETPIYRLQSLGENYLISTKTGKGLMSAQAEIIIEPIYKSIEPYNSQFYKVLNTDNKYNLFDLNGLKLNLKSFKETKTVNSKVMVVRYKEADYLYHDIINNTLSFQSILPFSTRLYLLKETKHLGVYNTDGQLIIPVRYHNITLSNKAFEVNFFNSSGVYKKNGESLFDPFSQME